MSEDEFHIFSIVEGHGEITALPKLLHRICSNADCPFILRTDIEPHRVPNSLFFGDYSERRKKAFHWAANMARKYSNSGVLILMDADTSCCQDLLSGDKVREIRADIDSILACVPTLFVLAEKGYESWLVAGLGGASEAQNNPSRWLTDNRDKLEFPRTYKKIIDQHKLTSSDKFDIDRAAKDNISFGRLRKRVLAMAQAVSDVHS